MKKVKLIVSTLILIFILSVAVGSSVGAVSTLNKHEVKQDTENVQKKDSKFLIKTMFNEKVEAKKEIQLDAMENTSVVIIEKNDVLRTTETEVKKKKSKSKKTSKKESNKQESKQKNDYKLVGTFKVTGYCACVQCCGKSNGITASGTHATAGRTIAADTSKFPFGTKMVINGHTYTVEDRGGAINGNRIDMFFSSHGEALQWGVKYCKVYVKK